MIRRLFIALVLLCSFANAEELLHPSVAFKPTARALDGQTIEVRFEIAKGYYLYRDKFRFSAEPASVQLGTPILPKGTYQGTVTIAGSGLDPVTVPVWLYLLTRFYSHSYRKA